MSEPAGNTVDLDAALAASIDDHRFSRAERQALGALLATLPPTQRRPADLRKRALAVARGAVGSNSGETAALDWLEGVFRLFDHLDEQPKPPGPDIAEAHFSPGDDCRDRIAHLLAGARQSVEICVFTITDDHISDAIVAAHRRAVQLRIITDNEKAEDLGSDVARFRSEGIPLRIDHTPAHMHHKFAIFDTALLLTGSYNWTRGAAVENEENLVVVTDHRLVAAFSRTFEKLWEHLAT